MENGTNLLNSSKTKLRCIVSNWCTICINRYSVSFIHFGRPLSIDVVGLVPVKSKTLFYYSSFDRCGQ